MGPDLREGARVETVGGGEVHGAVPAGCRHGKRVRSGGPR